jgi:Zn-dependent peptidase ImmA (M78 family)
MKIPKNIKLFGKNIKVKYVKDLEHDEYGECWGYYAASEESIYLNSELKKNNERLRKTFYHELLHCMCSLTGLDDMYQDHQFIETWARLMDQIFQQVLKANGVK